MSSQPIAFQVHCRKKRGTSRMGNDTDICSVSLVLPHPLLSIPKCWYREVSQHAAVNSQEETVSALTAAAPVMAFTVSGTSAAVFTCLWIFVLTDKGQQPITAKPGDDVTLQCVNKSVGDIKLLEWTTQEKNVFVWKQGKMREDDKQHESVKNRVALKDPQMKDGDVSVILKNVNINDTGTYECRVRNSNTYGPPHLICNFNLTVTASGGGAGHTEDGGDKDEGNKDGGDKDGGGLGLIVGLLISALLLIVGIFIILIKRKWHLRKTSYVSPLDEEADHEPS